MDIENRRAWKLYSLCRNQKLRAGMEGTVVGLDIGKVSQILTFHHEDEKMHDTMLWLWSIDQEMKE